MNVKEFLKQVAYIGPPPKCLPNDDGETPDCYYSNFDDSYMTFVGLEGDVKYLADHEITDELTHGVGFSPKDGKWYGWSHRAVFGFKVGSTCSRGDCHYRAANETDEIEAAIRFWSDPSHTETNAEKVKDGLLHVSWKYDDSIPNKKLHGKISGVDWEYDPENFGKGEWTAETMADAKQMAQDFNRGVS